MSNITTNISSTAIVTFDGTDILNIFTITLGLCAVVTNGTLLALSKTNSTSKKDCKRLQVALAAADMILGFGAVIMPIDAWRIKYLNGWYNTIYCMFIGLMKFFGDAFSLTITFSMASERYFAIAFPIKYKSWNKAFLSKSFIFAALAISIAFYGIGFIGIDLAKKPSSCSGSSIRINALKPMLAYFNCAVGSAVVVMYAAVTMALRRKGKKIAPSSNQAEEHINARMFRKEAEATRMVMVIVLASITFYVIPNITITLLNAVGLNMSFSTTTLGSCISGFSLCNASVNFFLYMWKDAKMRQALFNWRRNNDNCTNGVSDGMKLKTSPAHVPE